jgi:hypothetical protein
MQPAAMFLLFLAAVILPAATLIAFITHRQRLEEEAEEDAREAHGTAAE